MADDDGGRSDPPTVPERVPPPAPDLPAPELPGSATRFTVTVMVVGLLLAFTVLVVIATTTGGTDGQRPSEAAPAATTSQQPSAAVGDSAPGTSAPGDGTREGEPSATAGTGEPSTIDGFDLEDVTHVTVPDVVGMDLQSAQDLLRPQLRTTSVDATGQDRWQLVDRNWVVVRTDPLPATLVTRFSKVTVYVVKPGETPTS